MIPLRQLLLLLPLVLLMSCGLYRMPADDEVSIIPLTNNPHLVGEKDPGLIPAMNY